MKKIMLFTTIVLAATLGTAYANHMSGAWSGGAKGNQSYNGITLFCPGPETFDSVPVYTGKMIGSSSEESSAAGGFRGEESYMAPYNGVTVFSSGPATFDTGPVGTGAMSGSYEGSSAAGGLRSGEWGTTQKNGVTDFSGQSYD
jgi:hypothetical protein